MSDPSILILGCGNMGGAMLAGWLAQDWDPSQFTVVDPFLAQVPAGVRLLREMPDERFDVVLLGVKPQALDAAVAGLAKIADAQTTMLSILAGTEVASIRARLPELGAVVRVMPNLAAAIGRSPLGLFADGLDPAGRGAVERLLAPLGRPEWLAHEGLLDIVTALAGSGPAFVYRFIDALATGGAELGLDPGQALRLAMATVEGSALLARASGEDPAELARRVTSPGGTTAAGLAVLDANAALNRLIEATLRAARERGRELAEAARRD